MARSVKAIMIVEIAGRPAEHVLESLKAHIGQIKTRKNIKILSESYSEPKRLESEQEFYTCFAEVEVETIDFFEMVNLIFDFMPASFEILEPDTLELSLPDATSLLNSLAGRLHRYDEIAKVAQFQVQQLAQKLQEMQKTNQQENKKEEKIVEKAIKVKEKKTKKKK